LSEKCRILENDFKITLFEFNHSLRFVGGLLKRKKL